MKLLVTDRDGSTHAVEATEGTTLMEIVRDAGFPIQAICGGQCACATCHCLIAPEWADKLPVADEDETELAETSDYYDASRSRLTCQITFAPAYDGLALTIAPEE